MLLYCAFLLIFLCGCDKTQVVSDEINNVPQSTTQQKEKNNVVNTDAQNDKKQTKSAEINNDSNAQITTIQNKLVKGDSIESIMQGKIQPEIVKKCLIVGNSLFNLSALKIGHQYTLSYTADGQLEKFCYEIDQSKQLVIAGREPKARFEKLEYLTALEIISIPVEDSVYTAVANVGEKPQIAQKIIQIFGSEVNFSKDLQAGDWFSVLVEKRLRDGQSLGYGRVLSCEFHVKNQILHAYLFCDSGGRPQYYNEKGHNLKKMFLQAPLTILHVSSKFSHNRIHPIFGDNRAHLGVDYAAPEGTVVRAVADGKVEKIGWAGGFGKQIILKHRDKMESWYSHLSDYGRGLKEGALIEQGEIIGYVGSTGTATGPHLDFRFKKGEEFIDPDKVINNREFPVQAKDIAEFKRVMRIEQEYLTGKRSLSEYTPESLVVVRLPKNYIIQQPDQNSVNYRKY